MLSESLVGSVGMRSFNNADAQNNLGVMYAKGQGVPLSITN